MVDVRRRFLVKGLSVQQGQPLPWLRDPQLFTTNCTRCQACVSQCETKIITLGDGGFPRIDFTKGECTFCYQCAAVCKESIFLSQSAIPWQQTCQIDNSCLAKNNVECRSCSESCEPMAIRFTRTTQGVAEPIIQQQACTGCGACVSRCPVNAISIETKTEEDTP